jgi:hypothetical protein
LNRVLLSKQDHYDWGLKSITAICRTAGKLRRIMIKNPEVNEEIIDEMM